MKIPTPRGPPMLRRHNKLARSFLALTLAILFFSLYSFTNNSSAIYYAPLSPFTDAARWNAQMLQCPESKVEHPRSEIPLAPQPRKPSGFAYVFYATNDDYACSILVNIHQLREVLKTDYAIHVLVSPLIGPQTIAAMQSASAIVHIQDVPAMPEDSSEYYNQCMLKMLAFKMHLLDPTLKRVLVFDSDQLILKRLDHLFTGIPSVDFAAPRAYWISKDWISSTFMLITLSDRLWQSVESILQSLPNDFYDMELVNQLFGNTVTMLSGEYITLNSHWEDWNLPAWYHPPDPPRIVPVEIEDTEAHIRLAVNELAANAAGKRGSSTDTTTADAKIAEGKIEGGKTEDKKDSEGEADEGNTDDGKIDIEDGSSLINGIDDKHIDDKSLTANLSGVPPELPDRPPRAHKGKIKRPDETEYDRREEIRGELYRLYDAVSVLHFSALGKPWTYTTDAVEQSRPHAHPLLKDQFGAWQNIAEKACPEIGKLELIEVDDLELVSSSSSSLLASTSTSLTTSTTTTTTSAADSSSWSSSSTTTTTSSADSSSSSSSPTTTTTSLPSSSPPSASSPSPSTTTTSSPTATTQTRTRRNKAGQTPRAGRRPPTR